MRVCLWEGYVHSEQMADIRLIAVRRRVSSVRIGSHDRALTFQNSVHHMAFLW
jgi:hypothetical protein